MIHIATLGIHIPVSKKVVAGLIAGAIATGLRAIHVYTVPADIEGIIVLATTVGASYLVADGAKYADALAKKFGIPVEIDPKA